MCVTMIYGLVDLFRRRYRAFCSESFLFKRLRVELSVILGGSLTTVFFYYSNIICSWLYTYYVKLNNAKDIFATSVLVKLIQFVHKEILAVKDMLKNSSFNNFSHRRFCCFQFLF